MSSTVRDLGSTDLWGRSLERSQRRRELAADARRTLSKHRRASVAATAAVAIAPVATTVSFASSTSAAAKAATQPMPHGDDDPVLLVYGSTGEPVRDVQRALDLVVDGIYGPRTERAVFHFQRHWGLPATGKVDMRTWVALHRYMQTASTTAATAAPVAADPPVAAERQPGPAPAPTVHAAAKHMTTRKPVHAPRAKVAKHHVHHQVKPHAPSSAPEPHVSTRRPAASKTPAEGGSLGRILDGIASCESGGNPTAVGGGGLYHGLYQFDQQTWESLGGSGDPGAASPADQRRRAAMLYEQRGASAWPTCGPAAEQAAGVSPGEVHAAGRSQEQDQQPTDSAGAAPEVTAAAVEREPVASAPPEPQAQEPAPEPAPAPDPAPQDVSAASNSAATDDAETNAGAANWQTAAPPDPTDRVDSEQEPTAAAPSDDQSNEAGAVAEEPAADAPVVDVPDVPVPDVPAAVEPAQDLSSGDSEQPTPAPVAEEPSSPVADATDTVDEAQGDVSDAPAEPAPVDAAPEAPQDEAAPAVAVGSGT